MRKLFFMIKISKFAILGLTLILIMNEASLRAVPEGSNDGHEQERQQKLNDIIKQEIEDRQAHTKRLFIIGESLLILGGWFFCKLYTDFKSNNNACKDHPWQIITIVTSVPIGLGVMLITYLPSFSESSVEELVRLQKSSIQNDKNQKRIKEIEEERLKKN
jgi:hypothetical protein